jgi:hypothetical protein
VAAVQLVGAVGDDEAQRLGVGAADQEGEEVARRGVGPVGVLEHERDGGALPQAVDERQQRLEQARLVAALALADDRGRAVAQLRQQLGQCGARLRAQAVGEVDPALGEVARDRAQRVDERRVRELGAAQLEAMADEHVGLGPVLVRACARARLELGDQAALADAGLAGDEHERRSAARGALERRLERGELIGAADEDGAGDAAWHPRHDGRWGRRREEGAGPPALEGVAAPGEGERGACGRAGGEGTHAARRPTNAPTARRTRGVRAGRSRLVRSAAARRCPLARSM